MRLLRLPCLLLALLRPVCDAASLDCRWTDVPPVIDGHGDDPAWRQAVLVEPSPPPSPSAAARTGGNVSLRLLWDRQWLYFRAEAGLGVPPAPGSPRSDGSGEETDFTLLLKPSPTHPGGFELAVLSAGAVRLTFHPDFARRSPPTLSRRTGDRGEVKVTEHGTADSPAGRARTLEGRIPWSDFAAAGGRPVPDEEWQVTLRPPGRADPPPEPAAGATPDAPRPDEFATLRFVGPEPIASSAWRNERLVGSPDGPSSYAVAPAWPRLAVTAPVAVAPVPGSEWTWMITQQGAGRDGPMTLGRVPSQGDAPAPETLLEWDEQAYSLAFHPRFTENGFVYFGMNGPRAPPRFSRVVRYQVRDGRPDPASRTVILEWPSDGHNGAALAFGGDGMLFVTSGDGSSHSDVHRVGQNPGDLRAKILRVDVDRPSPEKHYAVPADNPFVGDPRFAPETWAYGLRNPWRLTFDAASGQLWAAENGQDAWEFAHLVRRGANYGWSTYEGGQPFITSRPLGPHPLTPPTLRFSHAEFRSLSGGVVYRGKEFPELAGAYVFGDFGTGRVWAAKHDGARLEWAKQLVDTPFALTHVTADAAGELLLADYGSPAGAREGVGGIYRLTRAPPAAEPPVPFPRRLSETGLFADTTRHLPAAGVLRYVLNAPGWHDGATGEHFVALPSGGRIELRPNRNGDPPDGTALVQTLTRDGRRLETRVLLKQQNDWAGYSYVWDAAQRDAELADQGGADLAPAVGTPWRVPSRAECMMCHSREANFALTLNEAQLNHGRQLVEWERRGILQVDTTAYDRSLRAPGGGGGERGPRQQAGQRRPPPSPLLPRDPENLPRLVPPRADQAGLEARARSYLAVNCAHCHTQNGGGNSAMSFGWAVPRERMQTIGERPQHGDFGLADARIVAPGDPGRSVLVPRVAMRGPGQMPPVGTRASDAEGVTLLVEWIRSLRAD